MPVNVKKIRNECDEMSAAWEQAKDVEFNGVKKTDFDGDRTAARAIETEIEEDEAALRAKKARRDDYYRRLDAARVKVSKGVGGHKDFGEDSALYGSMGFVRKSERRSGLRRVKRTNNGTT